MYLARCASAPPQLRKADNAFPFVVRPTAPELDCSLAKACQDLMFVPIFFAFAAFFFKAG